MNCTRLRSQSRLAHLARMAVVTLLASLALLALLALWPAPAPAAEPSTDPATIRAEIAKVRINTKWDNPDAVKAANERIKQLLRQLEQGRQQSEAKAGAARGESAPAGPEGAAITRATVLQDVQTAAAKGRKTDLELAEPVRKRIKDEYDEERNPTPNNAGFLQEMSVLVIDFSVPGAALKVDLLPQYKSIKTLVLTGGARGAAVDLQGVLAKAHHLPLQVLAIIHFRHHVAVLPESLAVFSALTQLTLINNAVSRLPPSLAGLKRLTVLHLAGNPITTVLPALAPLSALRELGLAKTRVGVAELAQIASALPGCKVLVQ